MKKSLVSLMAFMGLSFVFSGLQATLYFLPVALPYFWVIVLNYYSFHKSPLFILIANIAHVIVLMSFTTTSPALLILIMNGLSLILYIIGQRLNITIQHMAIASAVSCLVLLLSLWWLRGLTHEFYFPPILSWIGITAMTLFFAIPTLTILRMIDHRIHLERIDTLANLRV